MSIERFSKDMLIVSKLDDEPNDVGGLTAEELKGKFDEGGQALKEYINRTLLPALEEDVLSECTVEFQTSGTAAKWSPTDPDETAGVLRALAWREGCTIHVVWDGVDYPCTVMCPENIRIPYVGNLSVTGGAGADTGEPFCVMALPGLSSWEAELWAVQEGVHSVRIYRDVFSAGLPVLSPEKDADLDGCILRLQNGVWGPSDETAALPAVSDADNGKLLQVVGGVWSAAEGGGTGNGGAEETPRTPVMEEQTLEFSLQEGTGNVSLLDPRTIVLVEGATYEVEWDGTVYPCTAISMEGMTVLGDALTAVGFAGGTGEPFLIGHDGVGTCICLAFDEQSSHTLSIHLLGDVEQCRSTLLHSTPIPFTQMPVGCGSVFSPAPVVLQEWGFYTVVWDGTEYLCRAEAATFDGSEGLAVGNRLMFGGEDTGEPFFLFTAQWTEPGGTPSSVAYAIAPNDTAPGVHTVAMYRHGIPQDLPIHPEDGQFLCSVEGAWVPVSLKDTVGAMIETYIGEALGGEY